MVNKVKNINKHEHNPTCVGTLFIYIIFSFLFVLPDFSFSIFSLCVSFKESQKQYATLTTLAVIWKIWYLKIFIWSQLRWWTLKEQLWSVCRLISKSETTYYFYITWKCYCCFKLNIMHFNRRATSLSIYIYIITVQHKL